jgi:phenylalanyl-tRNA synthetase beta chain
MRFSYEWLSDYVDLRGISPNEAAELMTNVGIEIESVHILDLSQILVGRVLEQFPHPSSNRPLWVHRVDIGREGTVQIIAGAPNAVAGTLVPVAVPGTRVPSGTVVRDTTIAGLEASGMLCSEDELGLGEDREAGIMLLDAGEPGQSLSALFPVDAVLEAEVNSNRPDVLGHFGLARELAAAARRPMKRDFMPAFLGDAEPPGSEMVRISIADPELCSRYIAAVVSGVRVGTSPRWVQRRLRVAGLRSISNVVDVTNYVLLEYAQPLHAFDLAKLSGAEIRVRRAEPGESLLCLDGETRALTPEMLVIADADKAVAIAGVIGGMETAVTESTQDVLLESATFDGPNIRATARALGLRTEASTRFEKVLAPELALAGARKGAAGLAEIAGGRVHRDWPDVYPRPQEPVQVRVWPDRIDALLGVHVPLEEAEGALRRLGFQVRVEEDGAWNVLAPVFRLDVRIPEDVAEEVGRIYGYEKVPATLPGHRRSSWVPARPSLDRRLDPARQVLAGAGFTEAVTPALVSSARYRSLGLGERLLVVGNPLSDTQDALRTSLIPSLADVIAFNRDRERPGVAVFELAASYLANGDSADSVAQGEEPLRLGALRVAGTEPEAGRQAILELKSVLDRCARELSAPAPVYNRARAALFHPGRCAQVELEGRLLGHLGELHPTAARALDLGGRPVAFEVDVLPILEAARPRMAPNPPRFPSANRDLAVVVAEDVTTASMLATIRQAGGPELESVSAFDEYRGDQVEPGNKSVAFRLSFRSPEKTLTERAVQERMNSVIRALETGHEGRLRA